MNRLLPRMKLRLSQRSDSEHGQAIVRLAIACLILAYLWFIGQYRGDDGHLGAMVMIMAVEAVVGMGLIVAILINPGVSHTRRTLGMLADYATLAALMSLNPAALAPLYVIIMWVTIGNGMRYGAAYLYSAMALAVSAFTVVVANSDYWQRQPFLAAGLWFGLVAIPGYLSSLMKTLHRATEEARRANAAKSRFLATMSHEFRSPLNGIIGMAELMRGTRLEPEQKEYAEVIHTSAQTLLLLVEDVLDISAIEAGKVQRKDADFDLSQQIRRLQTMLQPLAAGKGLQLSASIDKDVPLLLHGDGAHLTQVLLNLMHNAIKFTERGGVALTVNALKREGERVRLQFSVRDTGIGVPAQSKERIFGAFEQVDTGPSRRFDGIGLGTTIAKTLVTLMEGEIGLEDNAGGGSHFWVRVPMRTREADGRGEAGNVVSFDNAFVRHKAKVRSLRVVIADDQMANRVVLTRILERAGHRVQAANDGEQALDMLAAGNIDLAVIDMHMPRVSGLDVVRELRFMQAGRERTPVIVLSADATPQAVREAQEAGARAFLTKPVVVGRLLDTIADVIGQRQIPAVRPVGNSEPKAIEPSILKELADMGLGGGFLRDFVEQCLKDASGCLHDLERYGGAAHWAEYRDAAHAFKGVAENLGAQRIAEDCSRILKAADDVLARDRQRQVEALSRQLAVVSRQVRDEVARLLRATPDAPESSSPQGHDAS